MKVLISVVLLFISSLVAQAQVFESSASATLPDSAYAYAVGQLVFPSSGIHAMTFPSGAAVTGKFLSVKLEMDTVLAGVKFELYALKDTTGYWSLKGANHDTLQLSALLSHALIGSMTLTTVTVGTAAKGAKYSYADSAFTHGYYLPNDEHKVYWLLVARSAFTLKRNGTIFLTAIGEASKR